MSSVDLGIVVEEIEKFEQNGFNGELSTILEEFLQLVAQTGDPLLPWNTIKGIVKFKLLKVISEFYELFGGEELVDTANTPPFSYLPTRTKILQHFDSFIGAPFTIQRLCEILVDPKRHYKRTDKLLRGLEKNVYVVSFIEPGQSKQRLYGEESNNDSIANGIQELSPVQATSPVNDNPSLRISLAETDDITVASHSEERVNGSIIANGVDDGSSSSSSSSPSSTSSSPTPDEDLREPPTGPSPKRPRLELGESSPQTSSTRRMPLRSIPDDVEHFPAVICNAEGRLIESDAQEEENKKSSNKYPISSDTDHGVEESSQNLADNNNMHAYSELSSSSNVSTDSESRVRMSPEDVDSQEQEINEETSGGSCMLTGSNSPLPSKLEDMEVVESSDDSKLDSENDSKSGDDSQDHHSSLGGSPDSAQDSEQTPLYSDSHIQIKENCSEATAALEDEPILASCEEKSPVRNKFENVDVVVDCGDGSEADSTCSQSAPTTPNQTNHQAEYVVTQPIVGITLDSTSTETSSSSLQSERENHCNDTDNNILLPSSIDPETEIISTSKDTAGVCQQEPSANEFSGESSCSSSDS